jgi:hypothetical protein
MLRRKSIPAELEPAWEAFQAQATRVAQARRALLACLPVGRVAPAPVAVGLDLLRDELSGVAAELDAWNVGEVAPAWKACRDAVIESLAAVPRAHEVSASTTELEDLLGAVSDVVEPLDAWGAAERAWRALRR